jgi:D-alanyl-D-alanine carboxypeptidase
LNAAGNLQPLGTPPPFLPLSRNGHGRGGHRSKRSAFTRCSAFRSSRNFLALGALLLPGFLHGQASGIDAAFPAPEAPQTLNTRFQQTLDSLRQELGFPGATAAYILADGTVGTAATGFSDLESKEPMTPGSRMLMASIGKSLVAAAVLDLSTEGALSLRDPLALWLGDRPWFSRLPNHASLSLDHLLRHTGGLPDHVHSGAFAEAWRRKWDQPGPAFSPDALVGFILDQPPLFRPGEGWAYTDTGYILLGLVVEKATGRSLYDVIQDRFLVPLRLGMTTPSDRWILPGLAAGYLPAENPFGLPPRTTVAPGVMAWDPGVEWAGGGFASNPADLVVWARELYEGRAMEGEYLPELLRSVPVDPDNPDVRYGAGVAIYERGPLGPVLGHGGQIPGYVSSMRYYPDRGIAVAFQINADADLAGGGSEVEFVPQMERRLAELVAGDQR